MMQTHNAPARRSFFWPAVRTVLAALLLGGAWLLVAPRPAAPATVPAPLRTIPYTDVNPYGGNFFLAREAESWKVEKTLEMAREAGLGWVKQQLPWEALEVRRGVFRHEGTNRSTWERYDEIVTMAERRGLQVIFRLDRPPAWARGQRPNPPDGQVPPTSLEDFGNYVAAVAEHYRGRVRFYQIWNEPNLAREWGGQAPDPVAYTELLKVASRRIKAVDPSAVVLNAPLAQTYERSARAVPDLAFLEAMYAAGARDAFDIFFANGYGFEHPPEDPPAPDRLNFRRVLLLRQIMERYGDGHKAVWFNEFGWNTAPETFPPERLIWRRVSEEQQAEYTVRAIRQARAEWPWAGVFNIWFFRQDGHILPNDAQYYFRMVDVGFTPRLVFYRVRDAAQEVRVARPGAYQETNPALQFGAGWQARDEPTASGGAVLVGGAIGAELRIAFEGGGIALRLRGDPSSGIAYVTVDGQPANGLPLDDHGRSYLDLYRPQPTDERIVVADGLTPGRHELRLTIGAERNVGARGNRIIVDGFDVLMATRPTLGQIGGGIVLGALALVVLLWGLVWRGSRGGQRSSGAS
jgi:hypothetical protein